MVAVVQETQHSGPFRWKLFVCVMVVMGAITAAAIVLTLKAHPRRGTVRVPPPQPVSRFIRPSETNQMLSTYLLNFSTPQNQA